MVAMPGNPDGSWELSAVPTLERTEYFRASIGNSFASITSAVMFAFSIAIA